MKYEELHEIRKMTRRGYREAIVDEEARAASLMEKESTAGQADFATAAELGYGPEDLALLPEGIDVLDGCGNPLAAITVKPGSTVMVAGCRTGADCFIAAAATGAKGLVVGVEETPGDVTKAREAARTFIPGVVEIRPGESENVPAADNAFDVVVTNCAVTFSYDKARVLKELSRVLKPGGSIILCEPAIPKEAAASKKRAAARGAECLENAFNKDDIKKALKRAGLKKIAIVDETPMPASRILRDKRVQAAIASGEMDEESAAGLASAAVVLKVTAIRP